VIVVVTGTAAHAQQAARAPDAARDPGSKSDPSSTERWAPTSAAKFLGTSRPSTVAGGAPGPSPTQVAITSDAGARVATDPTRIDGRHPYEPHPPAGIGGDIAIGWAGQRGGPHGYVARFEYEVFPVFERGGGVVGFQPGLEWWRSGADNWGFSIPFAWMFGARVEPFRATVGFGFDTFLIDQVANDTGVGLLAPFGAAKLGFDIDGFELGLDARIGYRWQFGADDHARWQLGVAVGRTWGPPAKPLY